MNHSKLAKLKALLSVITPESWRFDEEYAVDNDGHALIVDVQDVAIARCFQQPHDTWLASDNAKFITLSHEVMPDLLEAVTLLAEYAPDLEVIKRLQGVEASPNKTDSDLYKAISTLEMNQHYLEKLSDAGDKGAASAWAANQFVLNSLKRVTLTDKGFFFNGIEITNPTLSSCGRFRVDPIEAYGFHVFKTGGGGSMLLLDTSDGDSICLKYNGLSHELPIENGEPFMMEIYDKEGNEKAIFNLKTGIAPE